MGPAVRGCAGGKAEGVNGGRGTALDRLVERAVGLLIGRPLLYLPLLESEGEVVGHAAGPPAYF